MEESSHATPVMVKHKRGTVMDECSREVLLLPPLPPGNLGMHCNSQFKAS
ncbi:unnamed protein product [Musa textilis]